MPTWYAVIPPGLEPVLARELSSLGVGGEAVPGGVRFSASLARGVELAHAARTPTRLLLELAEGPCRSMDEVAALVRRVDWKKHLRPDARLEVHATTRASKLHFKTSVENKVTFGVKEALKGPRVADRGVRAQLVQRLQVRLEDDRATLSLDAGGDLLHFRGWREEQGPAPLRENLAAAMLIAAGWSGDEALVDPFCGSGTLPIEAALLALGRSPFGRRRFACDEWPGVAAPPAPKSGSRSPPCVILGADRDARVLGAAEGNARRAGVEVGWRRTDVADLEPPAVVGLVVANPPYGERLRGAEATWDAFGRTMRTRFTGWRAVFLAPHPGLAQRVSRDARRMLQFSNGGLKVGLWSVDRF